MDHFSNQNLQMHVVVRNKFPNARICPTAESDSSYVVEILRESG